MISREDTIGPIVMGAIVVGAVAFTLAWHFSGRAEPLPSPRSTRPTIAFAAPLDAEAFGNPFYRGDLESNAFFGSGRLVAEKIVIDPQMESDLRALGYLQ